MTKQPAQRKIISPTDPSVTDFLSVDAPTGKPIIKPSHLSRNSNEEVKFTCDTDFGVNSNPKCKTYIWNKVGNNVEPFPQIIKGKDFFKLIMEEKHEGKYQCTCENDFGRSEPSDVAVLWLLNNTSSSKLIFIL